MPDNRIAVITGAYRGIGREVARRLAKQGFTSIIGARDPKKGDQASTELRQEGLNVSALQLDVSSDTSVQQFAKEVLQKYGRVDALVNNAAIWYDYGNSIISTDLAKAHEAFEINFFGAWRMAQAFVPTMRDRRFGRVVNVSSGAGSLADMGGNTPVYSATKAALNAFTRALAAQVEGSGILVNSVCPGWVRTEMGGPNAPRSVEQGAASVVWAVLLPASGPTGGFFRDGEPIAW
ncbi:MAG TPA: SDR family oxidoreductase [Terriglobales bacterium]|nr:SDR family oxidoreductase [Terriglobales bacterium]